MAWRIADTFRFKHSAHHPPTNWSWGWIGWAISNSSEESHENTKENVCTLHLSCICSFAVLSYIWEEIKVRSNVPSLPNKYLIKVHDFPSYCFPLHSTFAWEHLSRKDTGIVMCTRLIYRLYLDKMRGINLLKSHFRSWFYIVAVIPSEIVCSANTHTHTHMLHNVMYSLFVLALQIISVQPWYPVAWMDAC